MSDAARVVGLPPLIGPDPRILILGSLPGQASLRAARYYAHPRNQFWRLLGLALGADLDGMDYENRIAALYAHRVALWDVVHSGVRENSLDAQLRVHRLQPLAAIISSLPSLRLVAFNGKLAARLGTQQCAASVELRTLPSSSAANTMAYNAKAEVWSGLAEFL